MISLTLNTLYLLISSFLNSFIEIIFLLLRKTISPFLNKIFILQRLVFFAIVYQDSIFYYIQLRIFYIRLVILSVFIVYRRLRVILQFFVVLELKLIRRQNFLLVYNEVALVEVKIALLLANSVIEIYTTQLFYIQLQYIRRYYSRS